MEVIDGFKGGAGVGAGGCRECLRHPTPQTQELYEPINNT